MSRDQYLISFVNQYLLYNYIFITGLTINITSLKQAWIFFSYKLIYLVDIDLLHTENIKFTLSKGQVISWISLQNLRQGAQSHASAKIWIKDLLSMAVHTRARSRFAHSQSLPSLIHQSADKRSKNYNPTASRMKSQSQKVNQNDHIDHSLV